LRLQLPRCRTDIALGSAGFIRRWGGGLGDALWLFVTLRVALSLFAYGISLLFQLPGPCNMDSAPPAHTTGLGLRLLGVWERWDVCWYEKIATVGYQPKDPSVNSFPFYSLLMRIVGVLFPGNLTLSGLVVSGVAYIAAATGIFRPGQSHLKFWP